ncbi:MAG: hypothetical protein KAI53_00240 [Candidatus Aenigmarchaeota archaeon]|nr:hypothetical protein [Candidatus Aenigmarchaeota archaeon]
MKKKIREKTHNQKITYILLIFVLIAVLLSAKIRSPPQDQDLLNIASTNSQVMQFVLENPEYITKITILTELYAKDLAVEKPVIYGKLPEKTLYEITYYASGKGLLAIVDFEERKVLKVFRTTKISLM